MGDRPFRQSGAGGAALLGEGISSGVNNFVQNYIAMKNLQQRQRWQAMQEGTLQGNKAAGQPGAPGEGAAVLATTAPMQPPPNASLPPAAAVGGYQMGPDESGWASRTEPSPFLNGPTEAPNAQMTAAPPMQTAQADPVGAEALAQPDKRVEDMSIEELNALAFQHAKDATESARSNEQDLEMLTPAYHYKQLMGTAKPYLDQWAKALNEVKANPTTPDQWRGVQVLTGEEDPQKALAKATHEYATLRSQYEEYNKQYGPLNEQLTKRGITPEMYQNEAQFLQFRNQRKFQPHTPGRGAGAMRPPKKRSYEEGTDYVPKTGAAILHQGEMVIPKTYADVVRHATPQAQDVQSEGEKTAEMLGALIQRFVPNSKTMAAKPSRQTVASR